MIDRGVGIDDAGHEHYARREGRAEGSERVEVCIPLSGGYADESFIQGGIGMLEVDEPKVDGSDEGSDTLGKIRRRGNGKRERGFEGDMNPLGAKESAKA